MSGRATCKENQVGSLKIIGISENKKTESNDPPSVLSKPLASLQVIVAVSGRFHSTID